MRKIYVLSVFIGLSCMMVMSFKKREEGKLYTDLYLEKLAVLQVEQQTLVDVIQGSSLATESGMNSVKKSLNRVREKVKGLDFWFRYLEPNAYRKINGPLPVEWETEVFEKFEKPYRREGAGLTLAALYLEEKDITKDSLLQLIRISIGATEIFRADSIRSRLPLFQNFYLCNRLFLLNLASIYTTGFECPDTSRIIPELRMMMHDVQGIYQIFDLNFPSTAFTEQYLALYEHTISFVNNQPADYTSFDHFSFIRDYVNPLFAMNQELIRKYAVRSRSFVDYSLSNKSRSIFSKDLYKGQNAKGVFLRVEEADILSEIDDVGKLLFYDPVLSGNNKRSCASCHKPTQYFTDTAFASSVQFNPLLRLPRNAPSLINAGYNHLLMMDGAQISLQDQTRSVIMNPVEMGSTEKAVLQKILSCPDYKKTFTKLLAYTPQEEEITLEHITSAITFYYSKFSSYSSPFDDAMNKSSSVDNDTRLGFNLFMGKAQCATCHFVPQFNGVKPPFVGSEYEVIGVPSDKSFAKLSEDRGRYLINPAMETLNAFRTGSIRNAQYTAPYMHNGVFNTLEEVIDFYDAGGGVGKGLAVKNQTLSADSLHLSPVEKKLLKIFMLSLNENIPFEPSPARLPKSDLKGLNARHVRGDY